MARLNYPRPLSFDVFIIGLVRLSRAFYWISVVSSVDNRLGLDFHLRVCCSLVHSVSS